MPVPLTYPGVYIEEIPSGVRTITGVATSITAFVGRAARGPVDDPQTLFNFGDFERTFGGLNVDLPMSYAVRQFFGNGGGQALVVRAYRPPAATAAWPANWIGHAIFSFAGADGGDGGGNGGNGGNGNGNGDGGDGGNGGDGAGVPLQLAASGPGTWANSLRVRLEPAFPARDDGDDGNGNGGNGANGNGGNGANGNGGNGANGNGANGNGNAAPPDLPSWVAAFGLTADDLFNLTIRDTATGDTETFLTVTVEQSPRELTLVLRSGSAFLRVANDPGADIAPPPPHEPVTDDNADQIWTDDDLSSAPTTQGDDGQALDSNAYTGDEVGQKGLFALETADLFNLLCLPPDVHGTDVPVDVLATALTYCARRRAVLLVDPRASFADPAKGADWLNELALTGPAARNAALYFPQIQAADPLLDGQIRDFAPCGAVAGVIARTDATRGVWKAPAGTDAALRGVQGLSVTLTDDQNGLLNPLGINNLRSFPIIGRVLWGARTLRGADQLADEYKYLPVRRLALFIEESLFRGTKWVVFEPNDEPLWAQIRLNVGAFMRNLFRQGAFQGSSPREAYFVKVDSETTTQNDINLGIVNVVVGFAPLKPAEFVVIKIQQIAGEIDT